MMPVARFLLLATAFAVATFVAGWWAVPIVAAAYAFMSDSPSGSAVRVGSAAMFGWVILLGITASRGPVGTLASELGSILGVGSAGVYVLSIAFPGLLAASAAAVARAVRSGRR